jgi:hypothetical protein
MYTVQGQTIVSVLGFRRKMRVVITDGAVTCPDCSSWFEVLQHQSVGASYSKKWWRITKFHIVFLSWWSNSTYKDGSYEKITLREAFKKATGLYVSDDAFNARVSELVGAGTAYATPLVFKTLGDKASARVTTNAPTYYLNPKRVERVLELEGVLEV